MSKQAIGFEPGDRIELPHNKRNYARVARFDGEVFVTSCGPLPVTDLVRYIAMGEDLDYMLGPWFYLVEALLGEGRLRPGVKP